jgi:hypothetical protein
MRLNETAGPWVVYRMPVQGKGGGMTALCSQREWEDMDRTQPGRYTLVRAGISNEGEAERLARSTPPLPPPVTPPPPPTASTVFPEGAA